MKGIGSVITLLARMAMFRLSHVGRTPLCNADVSTAPHAFGLCWFTCWRCSGIVAGLAAMKLLHNRVEVLYASIVGLLLMAPCFVDGAWRYLFGKSSTNCCRFFTGSLAGIGVGLLVF